MPLNHTSGHFLTPRQVAESLRFTTPRPVYKLIREGELPASKLGGRLLIDVAAVDALIAGSRVGAGGSADWRSKGSTDDQQPTNIEGDRTWTAGTELAELERELGLEENR